MFSETEFFQKFVDKTLQNIYYVLEGWEWKISIFPEKSVKYLKPHQGRCFEPLFKGPRSFAPGNLSCSSLTDSK